MTDERWLVVGLGNPEDEYGGTRHNAGAEAVRRWAAAEHTSLSRNKKVRGEAADVRSGGRRLALFVPGTYMNLSGGPVQAASRWWSVPPERIVVVHDEIDVELGQVRLKRGGGPGGHNGLRDVDRALGTRDYLRVRIGVGRPPGRMDASAYVLRRFSAAEREQVDVTIAEVPDIVASLVAEGLEPTQNRYHRRA